MPTKRKMMVPGTILCSNALPSYHALDVLASGHFQVSHSKSYLEGHTDLNGMENYWNQANRVLGSTTAFRPYPFICSSKSVNFDLITIF